MFQILYWLILLLLGKVEIYQTLVQQRIYNTWIVPKAQKWHNNIIYTPAITMKATVDRICPKNNNVRSYRVWRDGLQPVIIKVEKNHLWFSGFENEITKLFNLKTGLEWQLQLWPFDHNIGKVKQVYLHTKKKWSDSHVHNLFLHSIPVITTLYLAAVVGALLDTKPASARIYGPIFPYASTFLISRNSLTKCRLPPVMQALHFLKILLDTLELILKYQHFLLSHTVFQYLQRM